MDNGGPAFPHPVMDMASGDGFGMSLRDYFAALAMQALVSDPELNDMPWSEFAHNAYAIADAMLAERDAQRRKP